LAVWKCLRESCGSVYNLTATMKSGPFFTHELSPG